MYFHRGAKYISTENTNAIDEWKKTTEDWVSENSPVFGQTCIVGNIAIEIDDTNWIDKLMTNRGL